MAVACDSNSLLEAAKCLDCIPPGMQNAVRIYLLCVLTSTPADANTLMEAAKELQMIPDPIKQDVITYLLCRLQG